MCSIVCFSKQSWKRINYETHPYRSINFQGMILYNFCWGSSFGIQCTFSYCIVLNFVGLFNFQPFVISTKILTRKPCARVLMDNILGLCCRIHKGRSPKRYLQSRHCFAHNCKLEHGWWCIRTCLYATLILHYVAACAWFRQLIQEIISTKSSKTAIHENLDPWKFSAIRYSVQIRDTDHTHWLVSFQWSRFSTSGRSPELNAI